MKKIFFLITVITHCLIINAQNNKKIIWDKEEKIPIQYATIKSTSNYTISNENGEFDVDNLFGILNIQRLGYQNVDINFDDIKKNDTLFMLPNVYQLDEVVVVKDNKYKKMINAILSEFALEPHQENFFLRAVLKKNNEYYKIIDFTGYLEKKTLYDTESTPMQKKNYTVDIKNIRKIGLENRNLDFEMLSFEKFLTRISSVIIVSKMYDFTNNLTKDSLYTKINFSPKNNNETKENGYYIMNNSDNTINEAYIYYEDKNVSFTEKRNFKQRTTHDELKTNFKKNTITNKYQLNTAILKYKVEAIKDDVKDIYEMTYIYYASPSDSNLNIKNNINLNNDIFDLNIKYNPEYWKNHEILPLTNEMQEFINKVNSTGKNSDFRTKTNIK